MPGPRVTETKSGRRRRTGELAVGWMVGRMLVVFEDAAPSHSGR